MKRAIRAPRVSQLAFPYCAVTPLSLRTFLEIPQSAMSMTQAMRVQMKARPETRDMNTVPERWYEAPQRPKITARPERPAAAQNEVSNAIGRTKARAADQLGGG